MTKILAIDDEKIYQNLIIHALNEQGYLIETASSGNEGIQKARSFAPDLIITDVMMPEVSGYEVIRVLREEEAFAHTPILMLTAQADMKAKLEAFESGADDYLTKPFVPEELAARIVALLRRAERTKSMRVKSTIEEKSRLIAVHSLRGASALCGPICRDPAG